MKTKRRRHIILVITVPGLVGITLTLWQRPLDLSADEKPLNGIALPPQSVGGDIFMDGGSVWVHIVDQEGTTFDLAFPYDHFGRGTKYLTAFHGAASSSDPGAVALKNPDRAKEVALVLLRRYGDTGHGGTARAYGCLSESKFHEVSNMVRKIGSTFR